MPDPFENRETSVIETSVIEPSAPAFDAVIAEGRAAAAADGPRIRWAGIIWGLVLTAIAGFVLRLLVDPARRDQASEWWAALSPTGMVLTVLVAFGGLLLIGGIAGLARRAAHGHR